MARSPHLKAKGFTECRCPECAALDLSFPGEGVQLSFEAQFTRRPARQAQAGRRSLPHRAEELVS